MRRRFNCGALYARWFIFHLQLWGQTMVVVVVVMVMVMVRGGLTQCRVKTTATVFA